MRFGITGPRKLTLQGKQIVFDAIVERDWETSEVTSGAAKGTDSLSTEIVYKRLPVKVTNRIVIPFGPYNEDCKQWATEIIDPAYYTSDGVPYGSSLAYRERNKEVLHYTDTLLAFPKSSKEEQRSGTWMTIRMAVKQDIPVIVIPINGDKSYNI